jgi:uncharacterized protein YbjT (DUF2867 family)
MTSTALLVGAAGPLGSAVLEHALGAFARVRVLVDGPVAAAMRGFEALPVAALEQATPLGADTAFIVFDRQRHAHGREDAFHRPRPEQLPALAQALQRGGVRCLLVVLPHAPALLPEALKRGLASLDEHAVASLPFEQLVIVRSAQVPLHARAASRLQRLADGVLAQLHWMVPQREQPVRAAKVAALVVQLARLLPGSRAGARIVPPELVWEFAQAADGVALLRAWLHGEAMPTFAVKPPRY